MSDCRMENTLNNLRDCYEHWDDTLSERELKYRAKILKLAHEIVYNYGDEDGEEDGKEDDKEVL